MLQGKHIVVGISGGIAAYKIPSLIRLLKKSGAEVKVTTTRNALEFVTPLVLETLSGNKVYSDVFATGNDHTTEHISLPDWSDLMIIAPATANVIGKCANGIADDALSTTFLAMRKPVIIAPAMNANMLLHPALQRNILQLKEYSNCMVLPTDSGYLACGSTGDGRMLEPEDIVHQAEVALTTQDLRGKRVLITGGPTREKLDPVRFISNYSTGKMSVAIAEECALRGAEVTLVLGPCDTEPQQVPLNPIRVYHVESAQEMLSSAQKVFESADMTILCAAVADYRPEQSSDHKLKRMKEDGGEAISTLHLTENADIAATLSAQKRQDQTLVGFALETDHEAEHAKRKMQRKGLDYIVLNSLRDKGAGFGHDTNKVTIFASDGRERECPLESKKQTAKDIIDFVENK